ncbi:MAG: hypothetical protein M3680_10905 [Myxococcota bacterium]|nr:hypothetical protein [Myxococcota bacterium]
MALALQTPPGSTRIVTTIVTTTGSIIASTIIAGRSSPDASYQLYAM